VSRALIVLNGNADRMRVVRWAEQAPFGTRVEFKQTKRSLPQNDRMWAMLTDIAAQKEHCGRKYTPDQWKVLFMHACGREMQFVPTLDGQSFMPLGYRSSELSKDEMSALIDCMLSWGAENGVTFHDQAEAACGMSSPPRSKRKPRCAPRGIAKDAHASSWPATITMTTTRPTQWAAKRPRKLQGASAAPVIVKTQRRTFRRSPRQSGASASGSGSSPNGKSGHGGNSTARRFDAGRER
jgi:hypothetical protein